MGPYEHFGPGFIDRPGWDGFGWLMPLLFLSVFAGIAVWAILRMTRQQQQQLAAATPAGAPPAYPAAPQDGAVEHARLRYAMGEITREEYLQIARDLGAPAEPTGGDLDG